MEKQTSICGQSGSRWELVWLLLETSNLIVPFRKQGSDKVEVDEGILSLLSLSSVPQFLDFPNVAGDELLHAAFQF